MARKTVAILAAFNQENRAKKGNLLLLLKGRLDQQVQQGQLEERAWPGQQVQLAARLLQEQQQLLKKAKKQKLFHLSNAELIILIFTFQKEVKVIQGLRGIREKKAKAGLRIFLAQWLFPITITPKLFLRQGLKFNRTDVFPLMHVQVDVGEIANLDIVENTIKFTNTGIYKIQFITNAYIKRAGQVFDSSEDFVAVAFRQVESDAIVAAATAWTPSECATNVVGQGIFIVNDVSKPYELVNTRPRSIFLSGCSVGRTVSQSLLSVPMVSIVITRML